MAKTNNKRNEIRGVKQALKIAGEGGISKSELKTIMDTTGKSGASIIQKLDKVNKGLKSKDKAGIALNSGAANMLIKQAQPSSPGEALASRVFGNRGQESYGSGRIGRALQGMMGSVGYSAPRNPRSGAPYGGSTAATPSQLMIGGTQIRSGGRQAVRGFGKQYEGLGSTGAESAADTTVGTGTEAGAMGTTSGTPDEGATEGTDATLSSGAGGLDLASWATGFKRARSARQRAGRRAQGVGSMKKFKFKEAF